VVGLTYSSYITQIATLAVVEENDENFVKIIPSMIEYAELRIQRDLDFMEASGVYIASLAAGTRNISIPAGTFVTSEQVNLISPAGETDPETAERIPLLPTTKEFLDAVYGSSSATGVPKYYAPFNDNLFLVGPFANATYSVEMVGMQRFAPLSAVNTTTFISTYLPDLFIMASMIYVSGYQRNFGRQADDPGMAVSYESQYQALLKGAAVEEARKKYEGPAWSSQSPAPVASPTR